MMNDEQVEKIRQAIMRYRELMDHIRETIAQGERDYTALFAALTEEQRTSLSEKSQQREAAIHALNDLAPLQRSLLRLRFGMRDMEREFEATYNNTFIEE